MRTLRLETLGSIAALLLLAIVPACAQQCVFSIPRLDNIVIDGKAKDWGANGFAVGIMERSAPVGPTRPDSDATFRLGWDDQGLLVLLNVEDAVRVEADTPEDTWRFDSAELFVGTAPGSKHFYQVLFNPGVAKRDSALVTRFNDCRVQREPALTAEAARTRTKKGYLLEVRLPWANLGITPALRREVGFQMMVNDHDGAIRDDRQTEHSYWYPEMGTVWNSARMQRLRLAETADPIIRSLALLRVSENLEPSVMVMAASEYARKPVILTSGLSSRGSALLVPVPESGFVTATLPLPHDPARPETIRVAVDDQIIADIPFARVAAAIAARTKEVKKGTVMKLDPSRLFNALNLEYPGLEKVKTALLRGDEDYALRLLLDYYRKRTGVWYPAAQTLGAEVPASTETIARADDTLKNIFLARADVVNASYGPQDYGKDINWDANPVNDLAWVACMHRSEWDRPLAGAYLTTNDEKYAAKWVELTRDWIGKNPMDRDREAFAYAPLQIGVRSWRWCGDFELYKNSRAFTPDFLRLFLAAVHDQAEKTAQQRTFSHSNPTIVEADGLLRIALVFPEFKQSHAWFTRGNDLLVETVGKQFTEDGVQTEWSINYHMACAGLVVNIVEYLKKNNRTPSPALSAAAEKMYDYLLAAISPDRQYPMFSDARRPSHDIVGALRKGAAVFDKPQYLAVVDEKADGYPQQRSFAFPEAGMYYLRSGWNRDDIYMAVHCSPKAASSHDQPDNGTFEVHAFGRWLMPDSGCYAYGHGTEFQKERPWFGSSIAHQTLTLDGKNSVNAAKHLLWQDADRYSVATFENGSYPNLTHRRTIFFVDRSFFVLLDEALGDAKGALDLHFQLAPGPSVVDTVKKTARTDFPDGGNLLVWTPQDAPVTMVEELGQVSFQFHTKEPRPAIAYRHNGQDPAAYLTVIVPYQGTTVPTVAAALPANYVPGNNRAELTVTLNGKSYRLLRDLGTGEAWCKAE